MKETENPGIGVVYFPELSQLIESHLDLIGTLEVEPQTLWYSPDDKCDSFAIDEKASLRLKDLLRPKIFHCVGFPVGGSVLPAAHYFEVLNRHARMLEPLWASEHLSFNKFLDSAGELTEVNFLLPPLQTTEGVATAVRAIKNFHANLNLPFCFETGTNYIKPRGFELEDGEFIAQIAEQADCGILLDLHNALANERNGRQKVRDFLAQIPLDRVWEIHVAGGFEYKNYYLDAHSGFCGAELFDLLRRVVRKTPNLRAINFEILPQYAGYISEKDYRKQLETLNRIWDSKAKSRAKPAHRKISSRENKTAGCTVKEWEYALGKTVSDLSFHENDLAKQFSNDEGVKIINELLFHFRASAIVGSLKMTTRLLRLACGEELFKAELEDFFAVSHSKLFPLAALKSYAAYLREKDYKIEYLYGVLEFEMSALMTAADHQIREVEFDFNPFPVFRELEDFKQPVRQDAAMRFSLVIKPDEMTGDNDLLKLKAVFGN